MTAGISPDKQVEPGAKRLAGWLGKPITQGLLFSLVLHFAVIVLFQPAPGSSARHTVVLNARLLSTEPAVTPTKQEVFSEPLLTSGSAPSSNMLTATTPSPAPPIPQSAPPAEETPSVQPPPVTPLPDAASEASDATSADPPPSASQQVESTYGGPQSTGLPSLPMGIDTHWYQALQVDKHPKAIATIKPDYPEEALQRNIEGTLKLMLKIDDLGRVQSAEVVEAIPPGVFDEAALAAFRNAKFQPAMKDGRPVRYRAYMRVDFKLKD